LIIFCAAVTVTSLTRTHTVIYATAVSRKNRLFKSGKTIRLRWDFCRSRICAEFGKSAGFHPVQP